MDNYILSIVSNNNEGFIEINNNDNEITRINPSEISYDSPILDVPIKYNNRIAYGVAENKQYVELSNFKNTPKIHLAPSKLPLFSKKYSGNNQRITTYTSEESKFGFRVHVYSNADTYTRNFSLPNTFTLATTGTAQDDIFTTEAGCIQIGMDFSLKVDGDWGTPAVGRVTFVAYPTDQPGYEGGIGLYRYTKNDKDTFYASFMSNELPPNQYRVDAIVQTNQSPVGSTYARVRVSGGLVTKYGSQKEILEGEVNWIAIDSD